MVCNIHLSLILWKYKVLGKTNLFYLPKYFRKVERERKEEQKKGEEKVI
jgi:hypothetical protein